MGEIKWVRLDCLSQAKTSDFLIPYARNAFLTNGTRISLSMAVCDFSVSVCLSHPMIKLLSQTVNHCFI